MKKETFVTSGSISCVASSGAVMSASGFRMHERTVKRELLCKEDKDDR